MGDLSSLNFNAAAVEPSTGFEPLPAGDYECIVDKAGTKPTKSGTGTMLVIEYQVLSGPCKGRKLFDRMNVINQNQQAQEIGQRDLSSLCRACGIASPQDSREFVGKMLVVKVKIEPARDGYEAGNRVVGRSKLAGASAARADEAPF